MNVSTVEEKELEEVAQGYTVNGRARIDEIYNKVMPINC